MTGTEPTSTNIGEQLKTLLNGLNYPNTNNKVFKKVLKGYPEQDIFTFEGPLCVTYVKSTSSYVDTMSRHNKPEYRESVIGIVIKGTQTKKYDKATEIIDIIEDKFSSDHNWIRLNNTVRNTQIRKCTTTPVQSGRKLNVLVVFELKHHVYMK